MLRPPSVDDLREIARMNALDLTEDELRSYAAIAPGLFEQLETLDQRPVRPPVTSDRVVRDSGSRPSRREDPLNAIAHKCSVSTTRRGRLDGKRIGLKDNIAVAGVPMSCSSRVLSSYVPDTDATVVTRVLEEGAEIVAMLNCDDMAWSARGQTSAYGPIRNPHNPAYLAGGSSGGSAAALYYDEIDLTLGCDQGGSIRIPASWSGVVGLRPTFGLVPYTGILAGEPTLDCVGPMARSVGDVALLLEVIAGRDSADPRQDGVSVERYVAATKESVEGLRIGIVEEGFSHTASEEAVSETVRETLAHLTAQGIVPRDCSVPVHSDFAYAVQLGIDYEGGAAIFRGHGLGYGWQGFYQESLGKTLGESLRGSANDLSEETKLTLLFGTYLSTAFDGRVYSRAQNLRQVIRAEYDKALEEFDVLAMPTVPMRAQPYEADISWIERVGREFGMGANTAPFSATGHPSVSVPCGSIDGLPVGLMLVGKHFDESTLLRAAQAIESSQQAD
jgi:amidase